MTGRSGAGASVSSGADYQARVAAYAIANGLVGSRIAALEELHAEHIEHEVREQVDDLIIRTQEGIDIYVQAKRQLSWSLSPSSDFGSTVAQFARQHASGRRGLYALATTSASSRRVAMELPAALLAYRSGTLESFLRDQPASHVALLTDLVAAIKKIAIDFSEDDVDDLLKRIRVARLDLDEGEPLQQALRMRLGGGGFLPDDLVWAKLIADSLDAARRRITISIHRVRESLSNMGLGHGITPNLETAEPANGAGLAIKSGDIACGKDWLLGRFDGDDDWTAIELYRFDDQCRERTEYLPEGKAAFGDRQLSVAVRSSACAGLLRYADRNPNLFKDRQITIIGANIEDDPDASDCAVRHEEKIRGALTRNSKPKHCVHCGIFVSEAEVEIVETFPDSAGVFEVGLVHERCRFPLDRVVAHAQMPLFEEHPELVGFDVESWIAAAEQGGQGFMGAVLAAGRQLPTVMWSRPSRGSGAGLYVIRLDLEGGGDAYVTVRGALQRYTKAEAERRARTLAGQISLARKRGDPFCIIPEGQKSGNHSGLLATFGLSEDIRKVLAVHVEPFSKTIGARYPQPPPYYAPLTYLADAETGETVYWAGAAVILTNPMSLGRHLANWKEAGFELPKLQLVPLLTDMEVDAFIEAINAQDAIAVIDPVLASTDPPTVLSGARLIPTERVINEANSQTDAAVS
jgi:hypothetical protein